MSVKKQYIEEVKKVSERLLSSEGDLKFSVVADSHLDNSICDTLTNIAEVDSRVHFDFMLHLGDFLNGNIPKGYTEKIFREQIELFSGAVEGEFYPAQGNHDGYFDAEGFGTSHVSTDELWEASTGRKPYYYVDLPGKNIRLISICSFSYEYNDEGKFCKKYEVDAKQIEWVKNTALDISGDKTVIFLSHDVPFKYLNTDVLEDEGKLTESRLLDAVLDAQREKGFNVAAWFVGHFHGDLICKVKGINFVLVAGQTAYVPQLWGNSPKNPEQYPIRELGTATEDLWDAVILDSKARRIKLFRFGSGEDRELSY
ncbi:MAG: metallophosphoesterase [Clostridia bacterium]|nr:metallophosphoesterase [Clostridia bacterium]